MKLKFERFEGLSSFTVRGPISISDVKILQIGLEGLVKDLESPLIVNLLLAKMPEGIMPVLLAIKKALPPLSKHKIHWISTMKNVGDFPTLYAFISRLTGFKHRQIGERLMLDDEIHVLHEQVSALQEKVKAATGDEREAQELILKNQTLKIEQSVLRDVMRFQAERMRLQAHVPSSNEELEEKLPTVRTEIKRAYALDLDI